MRYDYYVDVPPVTADVDLRNSVRTILYGDEINKPYGTWAILRRLKRNADGTPMRSDQVDYVTDEPDLLNLPSGVTREGYIYTDKIIRVGWQLSRMLFQDIGFFYSGEQNKKKVQVYFAYEDRPHEQDELHMLECDELGNPVSPLKSRDRLIIATVYPMTGDMGRVEFWEAIVERWEHERI